MSRTRRLVVENDEGEEIEIPTKMEICSRCEGHGTHVDPAVDGNGISAEEMNADPDFAQDYLSGVYDVNCEPCQGTGKVLVPDYARMTPEQQRLWERHAQALEEERAAERSERFLLGG